MIAIVVDDKLYVANAGDSKAVLLKKNNEEFQAINVSKTFNANKKSEQDRLRKAHPSESDVVICKRGDSKACYVKGSLMPTRAIGDLRLKHPEFNFHHYDVGHGYRNSIPVFKGPYITH